MSTGPCPYGRRATKALKAPGFSLGYGDNRCGRPRRPLVSLVLRHRMEASEAPLRLMMFDGARALLGIAVFGGITCLLVKNGPLTLGGRPIPAFALLLLVAAY